MNKELSIKSKTIDESRVEANYIVMPNHANPSGAAFGGVIISWIDICAAMVAQKHACVDVVTVHIDEITLSSPVIIGDHVQVIGTIKWVGKSSMIIYVEVYSSNPKEGKSIPITQTTLTMIALDAQRKAIEVASLKLESAQQKKDFQYYEVKKLNAQN